MKLTICYANDIATGTLCRQATVVCQIKLYYTKEKAHISTQLLDLHDWSAK